MLITVLFTTVTKQLVIIPFTFNAAAMLEVIAKLFKKSTFS